MQTILVYLLLTGQAAFCFSFALADEQPIFVSVSLDTPASNYSVKIREVYQVKNEVWVVSQIVVDSGSGLAVITRREDKVKISAKDMPRDAANKLFPVKHKVVGRSWAWGDNTEDLEYISAANEKVLKETLKTAKKIPFKTEP